MLERRALEFKDTLCIGRTHGVHAEPTTFGLKLAGWVAEIRRAQGRLAEAKAQIAYGKISGAVGIARHRAAGRRGEGLHRTSGSPSSRSARRSCRATATRTSSRRSRSSPPSLERMAQEIRHLQRTEVLEAEEPFAEGQTGSSAMPHKRNPELCERVCGLARVIRGYALTSFENVALWHERDISHSSTERIMLPDSCGLLDYMLRHVHRRHARPERLPGAHAPRTSS